MFCASTNNPKFANLYKNLYSFDNEKVILRACDSNYNFKLCSK